jgi:mono/diheme cytochrome c family protein
MKSVKLTVVIVLLAAFSSSCAMDYNTNTATSPTGGPSPLASPTATPDEFAAARTIFKETCSKCHGASADGGPVTVEGKKLKVPSLKAGHALKHSDEDFVDQISDGGDGMPAFKDKLQPNEINELVRFIRKEFQGR